MDRLKNIAKQVIERTETVSGEIMDDPETGPSGTVRQGADAAQDVYGQAQDALDDFVGIKESFGSLIKTIEREVKAKPLIAILAATVVGFVLANVTSQ